VKKIYPFSIDPFYIFDILTKNKAHHVKQDAIDHMKAMGTYDWQLREFANPTTRYSDLRIDDGMNFQLILERAIDGIGWSVSLNFIDWRKNNTGEKTGLKPIFFNDSCHRFYIERLHSDKFFEMEKAQRRNIKLNLI